MHKILLLGSLVGTFSACTADVYKLPETPDKLVVQSEFTEHQPLEIRITRGVGVPTETLKPEVPESVDVVLLLDGLPVGLERVEEPYPHFRADIAAEAGQELDLRASVPDGSIEPIRSESYIPYAPVLNNIRLVQNGVEVDGGKWHFSIEFSVEDTNDERYYEISVEPLAAGILLSPGDTLWTTVGQEMEKLPGNQISVPEGLDWLESRRSYIIDHRKLLGKPPVLGFWIEPEPAESFFRLRLTAKAHTRAGYSFLKSYEASYKGSASGFPVLISNIQDGIGIFTGYGMTGKTFLIEWP